MKRANNPLVRKIIPVLILIIFFGCEKNDSIRVVITTTPVSEVTPSSAKSGGRIVYDGGEPMVSGGVVWNSEGNPNRNDYEGITIDEIIYEEFTHFKSQIEGLQLHNTYYVKAYGTSPLGTFYGNEVFFTVYDKVTDIDDNEYNTIIIGDQEWMAENLKVTHYNDGTAIPYILNDSTWNNLETGAYSIYPFNQYADNINDSVTMIKYYGLLYNWHAAVDNRKICPEGWRVPSENDWEQLINYVESDNSEKKAGALLKSCRRVDSPLGGNCRTINQPRWNASDNKYGSDNYGFSALPGGQRTHGYFYLMNRLGTWWSSTDHSAENAVYYNMQYDLSEVYSSTTNFKTAGHSIRCMRDIE